MLNTLDRGVAALYAAAAAEEAWTTAAGHLSDFVKAAGGTLVVYNRTDARQWQMCESTIGPEFRDLYFSGFVDDSPTHGLLRRSPVGTIANVDDLLPEAQFRDTRMYRDFLRPFGLGRIMSAHVARSEDEMIAAAFYRTASQNPFDQTDMAAFTMLMQHVGRAVRMGKMMAASSTFQDLSLAALDQTGTGILFVDRSARVVGKNAIGDMLLRTRAFAVQNDMVRCGSLSETAALHRAIVSVVLDNLNIGKTVAVTKPDGTAMLVQVIAAPSDGGRMAALVIRDPSHKRSSPWATIKEIYGLTPTELKVAQAMVELDMSQERIAETLGMAYTTLKTHRLRIYQKIGIDTQVALVRLAKEYEG
jgi:DNA-binding CsgD family transcriptional regulator